MLSFFSPFCQTDSINQTVGNHSNNTAFKPSNGKTDDTHHVCRRELKPWSKTLCSESQKTENDAQGFSRAEWGSSSLPRAAFSIWGHHHLHSVRLFIWLLGDQQHVYIRDTGAFLVLLLGQCCVDNKVCSVNVCVCVWVCVVSGFTAFS